MSASAAVPPFRKLVARGLRRRCPRCGLGPLFVGFMRLDDTCSQCGLVYQRDPGSTWALWVLGDRLFVFATIVPIYFGLAFEDLRLRVGFFLLVVGALIATMPHRQGVALAIDYLTRVKWDHEPDLGEPATSPASDVNTEDDASTVGDPAEQHH